VAALAIATAIGCGSTNSKKAADASIPPPDTAIGGGMFGAPCTQHADCMDGYCVAPIGSTGGVCTRTCNNDCPTDWNCHSVQLPQGATNVCIPNAPQQCLACTNDFECGGGAVCLQIDGEGRCATDCASTCPTGYACSADPTGVKPGTYCQPTTGSCTCSAALAGASRACTQKNAIGTCFGTQTCSATTGWSACNAPAALAETCDGLDNDCDFLIDEDVGGGQACSITVAGVGTCTGARTCGGSGGFVCEGQTPTPELCNYVDDDCDGIIDEGFAGLGTVCSPGVGACLRYGVMRCTANGMGVACSVTAGSPTAELCNGIDDDCDGVVDETFPTLGTPCSAGLGVCARYGTTVCSSNHMSAVCSATAGSNASPETCNYLDDDCDGVVDNGFVNPVTGAYDQTANCGTCGNDCTKVYMGANSTGACSTTSGTPQCVMTCTGGYFDLDHSALNGCEFALDATSIYVSSTDGSAVDNTACGLGPVGTGTGNYPCKTITYGLGRAASTGRANVHVADGTYSETVTLATGKNLYGGYRADTWQRHVATSATVIQGASSMGNHDYTVLASNVSSSTFDGFVVRGSYNTKAGGNSYAIYVTTGTATLTISNNQIFAGHTSGGTLGTAGTVGAAGPNGTGSVSGSYNAFLATGTPPCAASNNRQFTNGGVNTCGGNNVSGGNGGGNKCTPATNLTQFSGISGFIGGAGGGAGGGTAGTGGQGGYDGTLAITGAGAQTCSLPLQPMYGVNGASGGPGANAAVAAGCTNATGSVASGHWGNGTATSGTAGSNGGGGGGGGAGGGGNCTSCPAGSQDEIGAAGGGGGAGGCAGTGGGAGSSAGGVFGIFIVGGAAPVVTGNTIQGGIAGNGGDGGIGGAGGLGGGGGAGGAVNALLCAGQAGDGGDGGNGGQGAGGGGGCGGSSYGIYTNGVGTPTYCSSNTVTVGAAGTAGAGGYSGGNTGGAGTAGILQTCTST
jgi:hypothetical protein